MMSEEVFLTWSPTIRVFSRFGNNKADRGLILDGRQEGQRSNIEQLSLISWQTSAPMEALFSEGLEL